MILGKTGVEGEAGIEELGFDGFELYLKFDSELDILPRIRSMRVVHQPKLIHVQGVYLPFDLANSSVEGHFSEKVLDKTIKYALRIGARRVVTHAGFFDRTVLDAEESQEIVARRINRINHPEVFICLENNPLWSTEMWINEPVLVDLRDFKNTLRQIEVPVGVCVDIEHLFRTAILAKFYQKYESEFRDLQDEEGYDRLVDSIDSQFMEFVGNPKQKIGKIVSDFIHDFFTELRPYIKQVHVCGFDYLQDQTKHRNSGAHLPLRYQGKSGSIEVKDRVDHEQYLKYVKGTDIDVVVEVNKRSDYNHIDELRRSLQYLRGILG